MVLTFPAPLCSNPRKQVSGQSPLTAIRLQKSSPLKAGADFSPYVGLRYIVSSSRRGLVANKICR